MKSFSVHWKHGVSYLLSLFCFAFFLWAATGSDDSSSSSPSSATNVEAAPPVFDNGVEIDESTSIDDNTVFRNDDEEDED